MGILTDLEIANQRPPRRCKFGNYLDGLDAATAAEAAEALDNDKYASAQISRVLRQYGWDGAETVLGRHRRKECVCDA